MKLTEQNGRDLYNVSYKCMEMRNRGCNGNCVGCPLNVSLYMHDEKEALLMKTSAMLDHEKMLLRQQDESEWWWVKAVFVVIMIAAFCFLFRGCLFDSKPNGDDRAFREWMNNVWPGMYEPPSPEPVIKDTSDIIRNTINKVAQNIRDANSDGMIDCVDYGMVFHEYWPSSKIMWHKSVRMNHIFVRVYINRQWLNIEPDSVGRDSYIRYDVDSNSREITVKEIMFNTTHGGWVW